MITPGDEPVLAILLVLSSSCRHLPTKPSHHPAAVAAGGEQQRARGGGAQGLVQEVLVLRGAGLHHQRRLQCVLLTTWDRMSFSHSTEAGAPIWRQSDALRISVSAASTAPITQ